jgi:UV DNA damage endonuclease
MIRLGLCCTFLDQPIRYRSATARYVLSLPAAQRETYIDEIAYANAQTLLQTVQWCGANGVGAFRINSQFLPLYTHPTAGYTFDALPRSSAIKTILQEVGRAARKQRVRLSFHPDQFVVPGSNVPAVVEASLRELEYQALVGGLVGIDQINLHGGGGYGDKPAALRRLAAGLNRLSPAARALIALENDDRIYSVQDLLPVCRAEKIPLIYDVHHHRCLPDGLSVEKASELCFATWQRREPWAHISSPLDGWKSKNPRAHADYINPRDWPRCWSGRALTVDVEAKAKERAVLKLKTWLAKQER